MRLSCVLLVAAATLVASANSLSTEPDHEKRLLRSHKTVNFDDVQDEERGIEWLDDFLAPEIAKRLKNQLEYRKTMFASWGGAWRSADDAAEFLKSSGVNEATITLIKGKYDHYLQTGIVT